jgi:HAD superfamily hydrolase (TIGR01509 family)
MIQALIFDFDGLILDTEWPEFQCWQETCQEYGVDLTIETWLPCIGTGITTRVFDPYDYLAAHCVQPLDRDMVYARLGSRHKELVEAQPVLPGIEALLGEAKQQGIRLAVASSAPRQWVAGHLERLGLLEYFDALTCGPEVAHTKPYPDLYLAALEKLGVTASQTIAFEDSRNGMLAARSAGIFCVVVPNLLTKYLSLEEADLLLASLADISLLELAAHVA